jgi:ribosomal protein S18 acetylase RimI-like enzyme
MIRRGVHEDLIPILDITKNCAIKMDAMGIYQWNENYPNRNAFIDDIKNNELLVFTKGALLVGCIALCTKMDDVYKDVKWLTKDVKSLYVHRLAVDPKFQKKGIGKKLMDYAEDFAKKNNFISIRLDTFSKNKNNMRFYERRGYKRLEEVFFPEQSKFPFYCYELII